LRKKIQFVLEFRVGHYNAPTLGLKGKPTPIGTPTSSSSAIASCYPYRSSPIDNLMSPIAIEESHDDEYEFDEFDKVRCAGTKPVRGG
jgi:hypothetical protein